MGVNNMYKGANVSMQMISEDCKISVPNNQDWRDHGLLIQIRPCQLSCRGAGRGCGGNHRAQQNLDRFVRPMTKGRGIGKTVEEKSETDCLMRNICSALTLSEMEGTIDAADDILAAEYGVSLYKVIVTAA